MFKLVQTGLETHNFSRFVFKRWTFLHMWLDLIDKTKSCQKLWQIYLQSSYQATSTSKCLHAALLKMVRCIAHTFSALKIVTNLLQSSLKKKRRPNPTTSCLQSSCRNGNAVLIAVPWNDAENSSLAQQRAMFTWLFLVLHKKHCGKTRYLHNRKGIFRNLDDQLYNLLLQQSRMVTTVYTIRCLHVLLFNLYVNHSCTKTVT